MRSTQHSAPSRVRTREGPAAGRRLRHGTVGGIRAGSRISANGSDPVMATTHMMHKVLLSAVLTFSAAAVQAAYLTVTFDSPIFNGAGYDRASLAFPAQSGNGASSATVHAGRFQGTGSGLNGVDPAVFVDSLADLYMYCYDLYQSVSPGGAVVYTVNFGGEASRTLDFLGAVNSVLNDERGTSDRYAWLHPTSADQSAAIQLGIWESLYESESAWSLANGSFRAAGFRTGTSEYVSRFFNKVGTTVALDGHYVMTLTSATRQDMITGDPPAQVPVPGTLALALLALPSLALRRRR